MICTLESSSKQLWMYRNGTYQVAYHPVGLLMSTWGAPLGKLASAWAENLPYRKLSFLDIKTR